ncbi:MAG TPA: hypothetical protein VEI57_12710 [Nitrospirota bacterium]|nr:hypothetical protein [Nitrospirota bacterium]
MDPTIVLSVLSALAAAVWSVWTWSEDQQKERQHERDREAALYINSFLLAIEELQVRLYSILEEGELAVYKKEYPDQYDPGSPAAMEILYRLSRYFGWVYTSFRYGPYTRDPRVIELVRMIGETFESRSRFPGDAFRFSYDERVSLGHVVVRRVGQVTDALPVFESITLYQLVEEISDDQSKHALLFKSKAVRSTLTAIDRADHIDDLEGYERLAVLQNLLVDLSEYLESQEGFRVSIEKRRRAKLKGNYIVPFPTPTGIARIIHQTRGRIRLGIPRLKTDSAYANHVQSLLASVDDVSNVRISFDTASVIINYDPDIPEIEFASRAMKTIEGGAIPLGSHR